MEKIDLKSDAFSAGAAIPATHTCDGSDRSPALEWGEPPAGTKSFALIVDDPDAPAGTWVHWVLYNLPAPVRRLEEGVGSDPVLPSGAYQGTNDFHKHGYGGPCPPGGQHRYFFKVYALDRTLDLEPGVSKKQLLDAMEGHVLAVGELQGVYRRKR